MAGTVLSCLALGELPFKSVLSPTNQMISFQGTYAYNFIPHEWSSFDKHEPISVEGNVNYIPMILFFTLSFFTSVGIASIPWMLLSEVFPFK